MAIEDIGLIGGYDKQQYRQFNPEDLANWYMTYSERGKRKIAMYPTPGRKHVRYFDTDKLQFNDEPRGLFVGQDYSYVVVGNSIYRVDEFFNTLNISGNMVTTTAGDIYFTRLVNGTTSFACFVDGQNIYIYREEKNQFYVVTDPNRPLNPILITTFGDRLVIASRESSIFQLSIIGLGGDLFDENACFTHAKISGLKLFASEVAAIRQFAVIHNTLYIFTDYTTGIWSNNPSLFVQVSGNSYTFPWKKNTTQDWNYGIASPNSLDYDFGMMVFLAKNKNGSVQVMVSNGGAPQSITTKAIDILFRFDALAGSDSPFLTSDSYGFLYEEDNTIFYRLTAGEFADFVDTDIETSAYAIEYNFETEKWHRCVEHTGERNKAKRHIFFASRHLVTLIGSSTIYELSGQFSTNEDFVNNEYIRYPMLYERVTPVLSSSDGSENITDYVEIDFAFGDGYVHWDNPFANAEFIVTEGEPTYLVTEDSDPDNPTYIAAEDTTPEGDPILLVDETLVYDPENPTYVAAEESTDENPVLLVTEGSDTPQLDETIYHDLFKPHIELYFSNDGGINYHPADVREFSQLGVYEWRMRWYQLGAWRNRVYKLVCVSPKPVVVLNAVQSVRRASGGAN